MAGLVLIHMLYVCVVFSVCLHCIENSKLKICSDGIGNGN